MNTIATPDPHFQLDGWRNELSVRAKNGINFISAATVVWLMITLIWMQDFSSKEKSLYTFYVGGLMLPIAFVLSKVFKTTWSIKHNPLDRLGLWLNIAQLFYFPFLFFFLGSSPDFFVMTYAIITGAHFFPYSWFYRTPWFAVAAGVISFGTFILAVRLPLNQMYLVPAAVAVTLLVLQVPLFVDYRAKMKVFDA